MATILPTSLDCEEDMRAQIQAERQRYIQQRLEGYRKPTTQRSVLECNSSRRDPNPFHADDCMVSATEEIPSVEDLRLQMQRERTAFLDAQLAKAC